MLGGWKGALRAVQAVLLFTFGFVGPAIGSPLFGGPRLAKPSSADIRCGKQR